MQSAYIDRFDVRPCVHRGVDSAVLTRRQTGCASLDYWRWRGRLVDRLSAACPRPKHPLHHMVRLRSATNLTGARFDALLRRNGAARAKPAYKCNNDVAWMHSLHGWLDERSWGFVFGTLTAGPWHAIFTQPCQCYGPIHDLDIVWNTLLSKIACYPEARIRGYNIVEMLQLYPDLFCVQYFVYTIWVPSCEWPCYNVPLCHLSLHWIRAWI